MHFEKLVSVSRLYIVGFLVSVQSARALLDSLQNDDMHTVRRMALSVYVKHPRRHEVVRDQEDVILR